MVQNKAGLLAVLSTLATLGVLGIQGCMDMGKDPGAGAASNGNTTADSSSGQSLMAVYESSFYSFATTNCAACHGATQAPLFATSDPNASYTVTMDSGYIDFSNVSASLFITQANNGHCGLPSCTGNGSAAEAALTTWANAELAAETDSSGGSSGGGASPSPSPSPTLNYLTATMAIPSPLPSDAATSGPTFALMRFHLSAVTPMSTLLNGAILEIQVSNSGGNYRIANPRIAGLASKVEIQGIHVLIRETSDTGVGEEEDADAATAWDTVNVVVSPSPIPSPLPSASPMAGPLAVPSTYPAVLMTPLSSQDSLTIAFTTVSTPTPSPSPSASPSPSPSASPSPLPSTFTGVQTNILTPKCVSCHSSANHQGGVDLSSYSAVLNVVVANNPAESELYSSVIGANPLMPEGETALTTAQQNEILGWINAGAPNN